MSLFECTKCHCVENTSLSYYWEAALRKAEPLCSECDPDIGEWHGEFPKQNIADTKYKVNEEGFLFLEKPSPAK